MRIENYISLRFLKKSRKNKNISSSSLIAVIIIATSIVFFISAVSIMNGFIYGFMKIAFEVKSFHIDFQADYTFENAYNALRRLRENKEIKYAGLYREAKVLLNANGKSCGVYYFRSVPDDIFEKDQGFNQSIRLVDGEKSLNLNEIFISKKISEKLRVKVGDHIYLSAMLIKDNPEITLKRLKISGIFTTGYQELDEQLVYIGKETGDDIFKGNVGYNIFIKLYDYKKAREIAFSFMYTGFGEMYTWEESNYNELVNLRFLRNIIAFIVVLVILVAALNILTTINITVFEKNKDIGILMAMGYSPRNIYKVFLLNGIYLGFIGIIFGVLSGLLVMKWLNEILKIFSVFINQIQYIIYIITKIFIDIPAPKNFVIFSKDYYLDKIYTEISFIEIIIIAGLTLLFSIIASISPAIKAGKIKPIEVIKNG